MTFRLSPVQERLWRADPEATVELVVRLPGGADASEVCERVGAAADARDALRAALVALPELAVPRQEVRAGGEASLRCSVEGGALLRLEAPALFADVVSLLVIAEEALGGGAGPPPPLEQIAGFQGTLVAGEPEADAALAAWAAADQPLRWGFPLARRGAADGFTPVRVALPLSARAAEGIAAVGVDAAVAGALQAFSRLLNWDSPAASAHVLAGRPFEDLMPACAPLAAAVPLTVSADTSMPFAEWAAAAGAAVEAAREHELYAHLAPAARDRAGGQAIAARPGGPVPVACRSPLVDSLMRLSLVGAEGAWTAQVEADPSRLSEAGIESLCGTLGAALEAWLGDPAAAVGRALSPAASPGAAPPPAPPAPTFLDAIAARAAAAPSHPAVRDEHGEIDFGTLDAWSAAVAARIAGAGAAPGDRVGLPARRAVETVVALIGALRAGTPFVPFDPAAPDGYVAGLLRTAGCAHVLGEPAGGLPAIPTDRPMDGAPGASTSAPRGTAYVLFTSGSTGAPRGVAVSHRALDALAHGMWTAVHRHHDQDLPVAINAPFTFDASLKQLCALAWGRTVHLVPEPCRTDPGAFTAHLALHGAGCVDCTPTQLRAIVAAGELDRLPPLVLVGGEQVAPDLWDELAASTTSAFYNVYGLTEAADVSTVARIAPPGATPSLGAPLPGVILDVQGPSGAPCPPGVPGELHVGGPQVGDGYVPGGDADRFHERDGTRFVRTGDLVRRLEDGTLEHLDRVDRQVKLRGVRVEPAEVEAALRSHPGVRDAVAVPTALPDGRTALAAVAVPANGGSLALLGRRTLDLGDGLLVAHLNRHETEYLREEILGGAGYLRDGLALAPGDVVLDVGANIGLAALAFHRAVPGLRIHGFEPVPSLAELAQANFAAHGVDGAVHAHGLGPVEERGELSFYPGYSIMSSRHADPAAEEQTVRQFIANQVAEGDGDTALLEHLDAYLAGRFSPERVECRFRRLSDVLRDLGIERVGLLKIDVQKSELEVLSGIDEEDFARIDQVTMEVHDFGDNVASVRGLLEGAGFATRLGQDAELAGTDRWHLTAARSRDGARGGAGGAAGAGSGPPLVSGDALRGHLAERLPEVLRPAFVVLAPAVPTTPNGKVDAEAVARLAAEQRATVGDTEPRTPAEALLAGIFRARLGLDTVGLEDNFYEMGGDSILQIQIAADAGEQGLPLLPQDFVAEPTVRALARIASSRGGDEQPRAVAGAAAVHLDAEESERLAAELGAEHDPW